nr:MAG TPA: hypothetical protein [Caudoviricetes sp.]DAL72094.1 MAG TPA: hypothetical protein [Caudoviricetes sp.]DAL85031.1 MAG TPA: hypothetical protein [Caudoviricetes sp.]DAM71298.1 MAG TPA: hypothetical protein [Caudoviricetes sp.]DAU49279.1 MAG TPA: hypothetical protein [Caudoviricetes sp.]
MQAVACAVRVRSCPQFLNRPPGKFSAIFPE